MKRSVLLAILCLVVTVAPVSAQVAPPSIAPGALEPGFVADRFYGPEIRLANTTDTANVVLPPFTPREFFQAPEISNPAGDLLPQDRLFRHDYMFTVPEEVFGAANVSDLPISVGTNLLVDILQVTFGLFETVVDPVNILAGLEQATASPGAPLGAGTASLEFTGLVPGTQYILRVAGVLNGFGIRPETGTLGWHGQYQGNIAVLPIPGALALFLTALAGLGAVGWRRRSAAST